MRSLDLGDGKATAVGEDGGRVLLALTPFTELAVGGEGEGGRVAVGMRERDQGRGIFSSINE